MENTLENKAKFFALYWGQTCYRNDIKNTGSYVEYHIDTHYLEEGYLLLTPLSQITDEDAIEIANIYYSGMLKGDLKSGKIIAEAIIRQLDNERWDYKISIVIDYLRSRGYALPYMGLSVEQLVEYGWIKLKQHD